MTDKIIQDIINIKSVSKKKVIIDRIRAHLLRTDDDNNHDWSIEKQESMLTDLTDQDIIELIGDTYKIKQTQGHALTELTSAIFHKTQKTPDISLEVPHTPKRPLKPTEKDTRNNFTSFRNIFMKELEAIKDFTK